jgi:hypothetical protein
MSLYLDLINKKKVSFIENSLYMIKTTLNTSGYIIQMK